MIVEGFAGKLMTYDTDTDGEGVDAGVYIEITDFDRSGMVEIRFIDRNETCYLGFRLQELLQAIARKHGTDL